MPDDNLAHEVTAAPDLLEAAQEVSEVFPRFNDNYEGDFATIAISKLRAAIGAAIDAAELGPCPKCGKPLAICSRTITGPRFLGCVGFPACDYTQPEQEKPDARRQPHPR